MVKDIISLSMLAYILVVDVADILAVYLFFFFFFYIYPATDSVRT